MMRRAVDPLVWRHFECPLIGMIKVGGQHHQAGLHSAS
jgi:hypothetical protein